jgi:Bifunctional DNA primase/polymerase, N-terminal
VDDDDKFEELPEREPAWMALDRATACRKRLLAAGYHPIPVNGKAPPIAGWQDIQPTQVLINSWADNYANATNTGILTRTIPAIDIDVLDPAIAGELEGDRRADDRGKRRPYRTSAQACDVVSGG